MEKILEWDRQLFLWLNSCHTPWLDPVMFWMTKTIFWLPIYLLLAFLLFKNYKSEAWFLLLATGVAIALANTISSEVMKPYFGRLRPSHEPLFESVIHLVNGYKGGQYGFASSHAANTFATAMIMWLALRKIYRYAVTVFLWAALATYTRIYLGVHYPGDIIVGGVIGMLCGWLGYLAFLWTMIQWEKRRSA